MAATWRKRWLPSLPLSVTVFCFWLLMNDEISVGQVVMALVLALVIPPFAARLDREFARIGRLRSVPRMLGVLLWDILIPKLQIHAALRAAKLRNARKPSSPTRNPDLPLSRD